jgi:hypothetical protein
LLCQIGSMAARDGCSEVCRVSEAGAEEGDLSAPKPCVMNKALYDEQSHG